MLQSSIIQLPETGSTNNYAIELIAQQRPAEGCVIRADYQTSGRGTDTNSWESERGKNLTFSLILYPEFAADKQFILNKAISLGIHDFLSCELPGETISIKWPNDIYVGDKKACGILIQNSVIGNTLDYVVVGIGLNVNQTLFTGNVPNPVSMKMATGINYNLDVVLSKLLISIFRRYRQVMPGTFSEIETAYQAALYRRLEWQKYEVRGSELIAMITGTNPYGQLLLETREGEQLTCDLKEVKLII